MKLKTLKRKNWLRVYSHPSISLSLIDRIYLYFFYVAVTNSALYEAPIDPQ